MADTKQAPAGALKRARRLIAERDRLKRLQGYSVALQAVLDAQRELTADDLAELDNAAAEFSGKREAPALVFELLAVSGACSRRVSVLVESPVEVSPICGACSRRLLTRGAPRPRHPADPSMPGDATSADEEAVLGPLKCTCETEEEAVERVLLEAGESSYGVVKTPGETSRSKSSEARMARKRRARLLAELIAERDSLSEGVMRLKNAVSAGSQIDRWREVTRAQLETRLGEVGAKIAMLRPT